jgi:2-keto-4-pentenoate hydratase/2-oxohepta-3-ene-1,7-dioic acid hydratase in catechol pathway
MKIVSFVIKNRARFGVVIDHEVVDLTDAFGPGIGTINELIGSGKLATISQSLPDDAPRYAVDDLHYLPPIPNPGKIICVGVNYHHRNEEYKDGTAAPSYPSVFPRFASSMTGHGQPLICPVEESEQLDYEGEIAIVIGKRGRRIAQQQALSHIAGLTCLNEGSVRDWLKHGKFNVTQGKNFDQSGSAGPWLVTADEFSRYDNLEVITRVNGEERQRDNTANLMFSFEFLIHYISKWTTLEPGDVISTGTPTGAGVRFDPPKFLREGDIVEVEAPAIGILKNTVRNG